MHARFCVHPHTRHARSRPSMAEPSFISSQREQTLAPSLSSTSLHGRRRLPASSCTPHTVRSAASGRTRCGTLTPRRAKRKKALTVACLCRRIACWGNDRRRRGPRRHRERRRIVRTRRRRGACRDAAFRSEDASILVDRRAQARADRRSSGPRPDTTTIGACAAADFGGRSWGPLGRYGADTPDLVPSDAPCAHEQPRDRAIQPRGFGLNFSEHRRREMDALLDASLAARGLGEGRSHDRHQRVAGSSAFPPAWELAAPDEETGAAEFACAALNGHSGSQPVLPTCGGPFGAFRGPARPVRFSQTPRNAGGRVAVALLPRWTSRVRIPSPARGFERSAVFFPTRFPNPRAPSGASRRPEPRPRCAPRPWPSPRA